MEITQSSKFRVFDSKEQVQMGLNLESTHTLMSMLRNNIYSDPLTSFVREVFSNAVDANVRAGRTNAGIDVYIEKEDNHGLYIVRDYGDSMDKEKIQNVYAILGKSDKTSDNTEIGGWGIGAASPLAYTDHFYIETWTQEGDQKIYRKWVQYIDPSRIGAIGLQEEHDAYPDDRVGTKISVPFKHEDRDRVIRALSMYLFYTKAYYRLHGTELVYKAPKYNQFGKGWSMIMTNEDYNKWDKPKNSALVLVGDIPYRLNVKILIDSIMDFQIGSICTPKTRREIAIYQYFTNFIRSLPYYEWELFVPIGSVDLSAAREDLQYTPKTIHTLLKYLYMMYNEYSEGIMMELTHNLNLVDACRRYSRFYGGHIKHHWLHHLRWVPEMFLFDGRKDLLTDTPNSQLLVYHLDKVSGDNQRDILRKDSCMGINPGYITRAVVVKNDTEYKNYGKFLKFYMQREDDKYNFKAIVVEECDWHLVRPWLFNSLDSKDMSTLVEYYRKCNPSMAKGKGSRGSIAARVEFRCFGYAASIVRERADGFGCLFNESSADIHPETEQYYISEEEVATAGFDFPVNQRDMLNFLKGYILHKGIPGAKLYYTKKTTKNFKDDNWISLMDMMRTEREIYKRDHANYMRWTFHYFLCRSQYVSLTDYKVKHLRNKHGRFAEQLTTFAQAKKHYAMSCKSGRDNFYAFTDTRYRRMIDKSISRYNNFEIHKLDWISEDPAVMTEVWSVLTFIENFFNDYPMLKYVNANYGDYCGLDMYHFLEYISIVEKHRGEERIEKEVPVKTTSGSGYTMYTLVNRYGK